MFSLVQDLELKLWAIFFIRIEIEITLKQSTLQIPKLIDLPKYKDSSLASIY